MAFVLGQTMVDKVKAEAGTCEDRTNQKGILAS